MEQMRPSAPKLRRTDPALHETIKRFVESQGADVRISQYADAAFAAKKLEKDTWYWLTPIGRSGYLVFLPNTPIVWIDEQFNKSFRIPIRVKSDVYEKKSLIIASLDSTDGLLRLEDIWVSAGVSIETPFTQRWNTLMDFYSLSYKPDLILQQGIRVEPAVYQPLSAISTWQHTPQMMLAQGETMPRRLRVQTSSPASASASAPSVTPLTQAPRPVSAPVKIVKTNAVKAKPDETLAIPHPEYPDTYDVWINGVRKGFAAVQDIELSRRLKDASVKTGIPVKVEWNKEFSMYEINDLT